MACCSPGQTHLSVSSCNVRPRTLPLTMQSPQFPDRYCTLQDSGQVGISHFGRRLSSAKASFWSQPVPAV